MSRRIVRIVTAASLVVILAVAITVVATPWWKRVGEQVYSAYFANANGLYTGDEVRILGVAVGTVEEIQPQPDRTKVTFSVDTQYPVPADAKAAILSPSLVTARAIQLVPAYSGGAKLAAGATIPRERIVHAQTPQGALFGLLRRAFVEAESDEFAGTDEASLLERAGIEVSVVSGSARNFKITQPGDIELAEFYLSKA